MQDAREEKRGASARISMRNGEREKGRKGEKEKERE